MSIALGLDFGTTSVSVAAVAADGSLVASRSKAHRADVPGLPAGRSEQSPAALMSVAVELLAEIAKTLPEPPSCLGVTGQMHGLLLVGADQQPIGNLITWQDKRSLEGEPGQTPIERFRALCKPEAVLATGGNPSPGYLAVTLYALKLRGELPPAAWHAMTFADWAVTALAGSAPVMDRTNAASTGAYDLERNRWSEIIDATSLPRELFPSVGESGAIVGGLTSAFAAKTGLPARLPVASAIGDHQAAVLGSLPAGEDAVQVNVGTGGQVSLPVERFVRLPTSDARYLPDGRYLVVGAGLAGGDSYAWVRRIAAAWLRTFGIERTDEELFDALSRLAAAVPAGSDGLTCEPFFRGTRRQPSRRGSFAGVSETNFTPGHVARAVLEGIAEAMAGFARAHAEVADRPDATEPRRLTRVIATGNGVRKNRTLAASLARAFALPVYVTEHEEEAAFGAAVLAGVRTGLWPSLIEAGRQFRLTRVASPDDTD